ncbi:MAG: hypothetical protein A3C30_00735 [Candidatus Levybacteria bacterium RIFCSPHIGHO2_02_FULL_40_18]|nr:MAG: hypothetical protein A2869_03195 [Candidatus Levybacteria bacterium RIFCSPHIGHO2_01_FULL_40_58]OGH27226.1 MAG: hypothetical protein A3C30_00735 [Candidatus Levybacteria bacterium RIFCSPHIGHO2_02_FULL_40_18]OGH31085.1 MAG: hypothetical protein A3E43_05150 [Candidatus Levybacteria bacterium RIFCSPHIGHO2_12_FULL_40_31]OGH40747.1 MAG: hypothetical protein A2894_03290 [Candidatus Levybacteria bacterium RIFCSPLOWO2_01_FULL_40_64]OGH49385.1 MAG: hypothetical protein A3I54_01930 [Candidatus Lev
MLKEPQLPISLEKQIKVYAISILLPPLGLWPGIKYLTGKNEKAKTVGIVAIILTIISIIITVWLTIGFVSQLNNGLNGQLQQYQDLGI